MSELEFLRRQKYKRNRKICAIAMLVAIIILAVMALGSYWVYNKIDSTVADITQAQMPVIPHA